MTTTANGSATRGFRGLMWWIDRWRRSEAFVELTLAEQGAFRNLLDEACLRGGALPVNDRVLAKASGDPIAWPKLRRAVLKKFTRRRDGWHNATLDYVLHQTTRRADNQRAYREREKRNGR